MRSTLIIACWLMLLSPLAAEEDSVKDEQVKTLLQQARDHAALGNASRARTFFEAALFLDPDNVTARRMLERSLVTFESQKSEGASQAMPDEEAPALRLQKIRNDATIRGKMLPALNPNLIK